MALHPSFPSSPYDPLVPDQRWFPADELLRETAYEKLLPPLVANIRTEVHAWRKGGYSGASSTSKSLLKWWFEIEHFSTDSAGMQIPFRYFFAQREAVETIVWLHEVRGVRDKFDLMRFDAHGAVSASMFDEEWPRYVVKMATGTGKTKVLSLLMAWSYFHRLYEVGSGLSRNFLLVAPNIIVLDRLRTDFDGLRIFYDDPVLPDQGFEGRNWRDDFQVTVHLQDEVRVVRETGNLFLTNIHRVFLGDVSEPTLGDENTADYFLAPFGTRPVGKTTDSKTDLGEIIREAEELAVFNDEAHHIHDSRMAWFKSVQDIHHRMLQKDKGLSLQVDVTATPRHDNGAIFVQTVSDYPLVEAIHQNVVKHPVLPDAASRAKLREHKSAIFSEKFSDYLALGIEEWRKTSAEHEAMGKKAVLFVMVDDTKNCDEVGAYLQKVCPELANAVLVIHTKNNGEIAESGSSKNKEELNQLRKAAKSIDTWESPFRAIVSVLVLKEGWDVRNVTTIVGLRAYSAKSDILPEQTLGRGLRRMYFGSGTKESVSLIGTAKFMEFVESLQTEGVTFEQKPMGKGEERPDSLIVEVDKENAEKDIEGLDIPLPKLSRRFEREWKNLEALDTSKFGNKRLPVKPFTQEQTREIVFKAMLDGSIHHTIQLDDAGAGDYRSVVAFFSHQLIRDMRLVGGYDILYRKVKAFMAEALFTPSPVNLEDPVILRNLSEPEVGALLYDSFKTAINSLTIQEKGTTRVEAWIRLRETRPFRTENRPFVEAKNSIFTKIVAEPRAGGFELEFSAFLRDASDVAAFAKNYFAIGFRLDYVRADGDLSTYTPDFIVRTKDGVVWIVETKGREELDLPQKMARLSQWCADATSAEDSGTTFKFAYVEQSSFQRNPPRTFSSLVATAAGYKEN